MKPLQDQNLKIKIQILDDKDNVLVSSIVPHQQVHNLNVYHNISGVDQVYNMLLDELEKNQQSEK